MTGSLDTGGSSSLWSLVDNQRSDKKPNKIMIKKQSLITLDLQGVKLIARDRLNLIVLFFSYVDFLFGEKLDNKISFVLA